MRAPGLAVLLTLSMPVDLAHGCHLYSVWKYPWPQSCMAPHLQRLRPAPARIVLALPSAPVAAPVRGGILPPAPDEEVRREAAVDRLRLELAARIPAPQ
jgi:hypothetical protein